MGFVMPSLFLVWILQITIVYGLTMSVYTPDVVSKGQVLGWWTTKKKILNPDATSDVKAASVLAKEMKLSMLRLKSDFMTKDGTAVDYEGLKESEEFKKNYVDILIKSLRCIDMAELSTHERKGFLINIYNCLCIHGLAEGLLGSFPGGSLSRLKLYAKASYNLGGQIFSLNDIENGLLRNNKVSAAPWSQVPFGEGDPRLSLCVDCDPRIHFALNCGANSCPPIGVYSVESAEELDEQLDTASLSFCSNKDNVRVDLESKTLCLSQLFDWYKSDFGSSESEVVRWVKRHVGDPSAIDQLLGSLKEGEELTVKYLPYDWGLNAK